MTQIAYMGYDSAQPTPELYSRWTRHETSAIGEAVGGCELLVGVPSYRGDVRWSHRPSAETLAAGLRGVRAASGRVDGWADYAEWTTSPDDWRTLEAAAGMGDPNRKSPQ